LDAAISAAWASSSFVSATDARHMLESDGYTVDPLEAVSPTREGPLAAAAVNSTTRANVEPPSVPPTLPVPQPIAPPVQYDPPAQQFHDGGPPDFDLSSNIFSLENLQNTMFTSDMPLVDMQDLLDFTGDIGGQDNGSADRWNFQF
jgi:hypothetical protein